MKCLIIGARADGHAKVVLEVLRAAGEHEVVGFVDDDPRKLGLVINGVPVLGAMKDIPALKAGHGVAGCIVGIGDNPGRRALAGRLKEQGLQLINAIHPTVIRDPDVVIGHGCYIGQGVILVTGTRVGDCVNIHTGATIDHDNVIEDGANVGPGVHTAGRVRIEQDAFLGTGTLVIPDASVGRGAICGAGTVVLDRVEPFTKVVGAPPRVIEQMNETNEL